MPLKRIGRTLKELPDKGLRALGRSNLARGFENIGDRARAANPFQKGPVDFETPDIQVRTPEQLFGGAPAPQNGGQTSQQAPAPQRQQSFISGPVGGIQSRRGPITVSQRPAPEPPGVARDTGGGARLASPNVQGLALGGQRGALATVPGGVTTTAITRPNQLGSPGEAFEARQAAAGLRPEQQAFIQQLQAQAAGTGGPSAAQAQLQAGLDAAARQQIGLSAAQSGVSSGAALRQGVTAGQDLLQRGAADAAQLRAQEQFQGQQLLGQALGQTRGQDIQQAQLSTQAALQNRALQLQELGLNQQEAIQTMSLELRDRLAQQGFAVDLEKLRVATQLSVAGMDLQAALARAGFDQAMIGGLIQGGGLLASAIAS